MAVDLLEAVRCAICGSDDFRTARIRAPKDDHAVELGLPGGRSAWVVCVRCGLVYQSPRPGPEAVEGLYEDGGYHATRGGVPEHYIDYSLRRSKDAIAWGLGHAGLSGPPGAAVDIGCGIGGALVALRERGWGVVGIEPDPALADVGRQRFGLEIRTGVLTDESFDEGRQFDLAYSCHVWEHLADPVSTSSTAWRLLHERAGHLLIVVPTFRHAHTLAWSCFTAPHTYMFTDVTLGNVLRGVGFDVVAHRYAGGADSELWLLARARARPAGLREWDVDAPAKVQRELMLVPLRMPLGFPRRVGSHVRTLAADPADFVRRAIRWGLARGRRVRTALSGRRS